MSITRNVRRASATVTAAVLLCVAVVVVAPSTPGQAAPAAGPAPAPAPPLPLTRPGYDPAVRVASLNALVAQRSRTVRAAEARRNDIQGRLDEAITLEAAAAARTDKLSQLAVRAARQYEKSRDRLANLAAAAYRDGPTVTPLTQLLASESAAEYAYKHELVERVGDEQRRIITQAKRDRVAAKQAAEDAKAERDRLAELVTSLRASLPQRDAALEQATAARDRAQFWLARWTAIVGAPAIPIMGPPLLGADELAQWFNATKRKARTTVPIEELTKLFVEEGMAVGVRSDIAFAQSILETGGLSFPAGGQVLGSDNNFAGMDACDSCARGRSFPDARTGVRAQLQQLRVYADPTLTNAMLNPPAVNPRLDQHHLKGEVPTWAGLTHTWATADTYGDRVVGIYAQILAWLTDRARI
jgi:hypothetical protein